MPPPVTTLSPHESLGGWLTAPAVLQRQRGARQNNPAGRLRFAFYGRMSTAGFQDDETSRQWQHDSAIRLIAGYGRIVAEFFDAGVSRSVPWAHRPQAAALLDAV